MKKILISLDDTGSMHACRWEVQREAQQLVLEFDTIYGRGAYQIAVIVHGDYCDGRNGMDFLDFTGDMQKAVRFIGDARQKDGGDAPEFYEAVLRQCTKASWGSDGGILVLFGDSTPHPVTEPQNVLRIDWREEADKLRRMNVVIHAVQCMGRRGATSFYQELARRGRGSHVQLAQIEELRYVLLGAAHQQSGSLSRYEAELRAEGDIAYTLEAILASFAGRAPRTRLGDPRGLVPVPDARFQRFTRVPTGISMKEYIEGERKLRFFRGCGYYPLDARTELIQEDKEVVIRHRRTGEMFTGPGTREMIGVPLGTRGRVVANVLDDYDVFVQSTSPGNRTLRSEDLKELLWDLDLAEKLERAAPAPRTKSKPRRTSKRPVVKTKATSRRSR